MVDGLSARSHLGSQASRLAAGRIAAAGISALWFVVAARTLSVEDFGSLALLLGLGMMLSIVTDLGLSSLLADAVAENPRLAHDGAGRVVRKRLVLSLLTALATAALYVVAGGEGGWAVPGLFAVSTIATSVYSTCNACFRAMGRAGIEATNELLSRVFVFAAGTAVLMSGGGLIGVVVVYAVADLLSMVVLWFVLERVTTGARDRIDPRRITLRRARSIAGAGLVSAVYFRIDTWLVALMKGQQTVGRYAAAYRCFDALLLPATAVAALSVPHTSGLSGAGLGERLRHLARLAVVLTLPFAVLVALFAEPFIDVVFGPKYGGAAPTLRLLALGSVITAANASVLPALALRSGRVAGVMAAILVLNVAANLAVIPAYGAAGAAGVTVVCEAVLGAWLFAQVRALTPGRHVQRERLLVRESTGTRRG